MQYNKATMNYHGIYIHKNTNYDDKIMSQCKKNKLKQVFFLRSFLLR